MEIGHVTRSSLEIGPVQSTSLHRRSVMSLARRHRSLAPHRRLLASRHYLSLSLQASLLRCSLKEFHFTNFSLFFSLTLSKSLSLSLFIWNHWNEINESLSLSLFFKTNFIWFFWTVIGWNFNFINILLLLWLFEFGFILSIGVGVSVCWCWCWWDINCLLV